MFVLCIVSIVVIVELIVFVLNLYRSFLYFITENIDSVKKVQCMFNIPQLNLSKCNIEVRENPYTDKVE